jgi:predicted DNA binding CopG/RHH family protein
MEVFKMRDEYDFSKMKSRKNPYAKKLKQQITIRLATETIEYFKSLADESGLPYQNLIDLYLEDCARNHKKMQVTWN